MNAFPINYTAWLPAVSVLLSLTVQTVCVAKAWGCGATRMLTALPWQDVLLPG